MRDLPLVHRFNPLEAKELASGKGKKKKRATGTGSGTARGTALAAAVQVVLELAAVMGRNAHELDRHLEPSALAGPAAQHLALGPDRLPVELEGEV